MVLTCPSVIIIIIIIINIFVKRHRQSYRGADLGRLSVRSFIRPSVRSSVRLFVCPSVCPSVRLLPNLWTRYFENKWTEFAGNWHKWSMGQGYKTINFDQMVKVQGHTTPKLDLEAWRRHHSWSVRSSRFSSYNILWGAICDREKTGTVWDEYAAEIRWALIYEHQYPSSSNQKTYQKNRGGQQGVCAENVSNLETLPSTALTSACGLQS